MKKNWHTAEKEDRVRTEKNKLVNRAKLFGDALRSSQSIMPDDPLEMLDFFRDDETQMTRLDVPEELKAMLIRPFLSKRGKTLVARMDPKVAENYTEMKATLLKELKLTPKGYLDKFQNLVKSEDETC